jgi:phosphoribosyl 1,2-cyclic phosphodiesterase
MDLGIFTFASSSSGNCYLIRSETTNIMVDVGITGKAISSNLEFISLRAKRLNAFLLTHEHIDHIRGIHMMARHNTMAPFYASEGTINAIIEKEVAVDYDRLVVAKGGWDFMIGDIKVTPFNVSHDTAEPLAYSFERNGEKIAIVTDTGYVSDEIFENIKDADILVLEANHERNILLYGRYPYNVKHRILGDKGHLSNEAAGQCLVRMLQYLDGKKAPLVLLAHLSQENNTPEQAQITIRNILEEAGYYVGKDLKMEVVEKNAVSRLMAL